VVFISQVEISLIGEVNWISDTVDNQRSCGAKIAGLGSFDLKSDRCVVLHQNDSYHHLTEDREPRPHHPTPHLPTRVSSLHMVTTSRASWRHRSSPVPTHGRGWQLLNSRSQPAPLHHAFPLAVTAAPPLGGSSTRGRASPPLSPLAPPLMASQLLYLRI